MCFPFSTGMYIHIHLMSVYLCVCVRERVSVREYVFPFLDWYLHTFAFDECVFVCVCVRESECERVCASLSRRVFTYIQGGEDS